MQTPRFAVHGLCAALLALCAATAAAQSVGIAYYDVDHLYDTIPALFYDDSDYTPEGRLAWDTERYRRKIDGTAAVIDSMSLPIVALWGVENEAVVRDLAAACRGDYVYLHRTLNTLDGMDFALLYHGDRFFPHRVEPGRRYLYVEGALHRTQPRPHFAPAAPGPSRIRIDTLGLVLCTDARMIPWIVGDLRDERPGVKIVVAGRTESFDAPAAGLRDTHAAAARRGMGNIRGRNGWRMRDRILADTALNTSGGGVFIRRFLIDPHTAYPIKTYEKGRYTGGCGYALPVYVYIE